MQQWLLMQELLPVINKITEDVFVFQQDNAYHPHNTVKLLCAMKQPFINPNVASQQS